MAEEDETVLLQFYDGLAADYDLVYGGDWDAAVERQSSRLAVLIRDLLPGAHRLLDCSCGIGTQAIGLAKLGFEVVGSDISAGQIDRARREARRLGAEATFLVADFRDLGAVGGTFDVLISCDNAIPHLLDPSDVPRALSEMRGKLRPGGLLVISIRDYDRALVDRPHMTPQVVAPASARRLLVRWHEWDADQPCYTVRFLVLTETDDAGWTVREHTMRYRAITRAELTAAAEAAGFRDVDWPADRAVVGEQLMMTARNA
ncbi:MAG: class I SAM-dependent methyltransferase [Gaiellales bacterium]